IQDRLHPDVPRAPERFRNEPDTDPGIAANREWARGVLARSVSGHAGAATAARSRIDDVAALRAAVTASAAAGAGWGRVPGADRAAALERVAEVLAVLRGRIVEAVVAECGAGIADADAEASAAVDAALHAAERARELAAIRDAEFVPVPFAIVS